jgi:hypothetical protein
VVFAKRVDRELPALLAAYSGRNVYEATYSPPTLKPFTQDGSEPAASASNPPKQSPADAAGRDERRKADLARIAEALAAYKTAHGSYPPARDVQTLCRYPIDAGCALKQYLSPLPTDPLDGEQYWYRSPGDTYLLASRLESQATPPGCPDPVPIELRQVPSLYCLTDAVPQP